MKQWMISGIMRLYFQDKQELNRFLACLEVGISREEMEYYFEHIDKDIISEGACSQPLYDDIKECMENSNDMCAHGGELDDYFVYIDFTAEIYNSRYDVHYCDDIISDRLYTDDDILCIVHTYTHGEEQRKRTQVDTTYYTGYWRL